MFDESLYVGKQAYAAAIITSASSVAFAIAAAIFIAKRLAPSVDELQREAKRKIEKFISQGSAGSGSVLPSAAEANVGAQTKRAEMVLPVPIGHSSGNSDNTDSISDLSTAAQQQLADLVKKGPMILLHSSQYEEPESRGRTPEDKERNRGPADSLVDYYFLSASEAVSTSSSTKAESSVASATAGEKNKKINNLVLITKRTSNLYLRGRTAGAAIYILSSSAQDPITTSEDGLLVISISQTSLILEAIKRTLRENPNSVIVLDNLTELIYKIGFAKVFSLVQSISDEVSQYSQSRILILINENAHPRGEVEAIATICNAFIR
jgi:hypothetical protein